MTKECDAWLKAALDVNIDAARKTAVRATLLYDKANVPGVDEIPENPAQPLDDKQKPWFEDTPPRPPPPDPTIISHPIISHQDETFEVPADRVETFIERVIAHFGGKKEGGTHEHHFGH